MIIFVLDDGETWTLTEPTPVPVTAEQLARIEGGEKVYRVVPDWDEQQSDEWDRESIEAFFRAHPITPEEQASFDRARIRLAQQLGASADDIAEIKSEIEADDPALFMDPVEYAEVYDKAEYDFIQAGIAARERLKKTAMESAQEYIDSEE